MSGWDELVNEVLRRPGMFVGGPETYTRVRCFVEGFGYASDDDVLDGFQRWVSGQPQHEFVRNYAWWFLILREVVEAGDEAALTDEQERLAIGHL